MWGRSVNLTTLFLGRLRPPKRLTSTSCTYFQTFKVMFTQKIPAGPRSAVGRAPDSYVRGPGSDIRWGWSGGAMVLGKLPVRGRPTDFD